MKLVNFTKVFVATLMLLFAIPALADGNGTDTVPPTPPNPVGDLIEIPIEDIEWIRSLSEPVTAYYYTTDYTIEMEFNENVGVVTVVVTDPYGVPVYNFAHDTSIESGCVIFIPRQSGCFNISITGSRYQGSGQLCL